MIRPGTVPRALLAGIIALLLIVPSAASAQTSTNASAPSSAQATVEDDPDLDFSNDQPDFSLATLPTTLRLPRFKSAFRVTHRFGRPLGLGDFESLHWAGWLPDRRLVVEVVRAGGKTAVEIVSTDGATAATFLPEGATLRGGRLISPDGSRIVAFSADERIEVCAVASTVLPAISPEAGGSGWRWGARSCMNPRFCFLTSQPEGSIRYRVVSSGA